MNRFWLVMTLIVAATAPGLMPAQTGGRAEVLLEAAKKKELVSGDLEAAIRQYRDIVAKYPTDRAVAAEALVRMGECYEKMGASQSKEAQKAYERVVGEYADQKEAVAEARKYLAAVTTAEADNGLAINQLVWPTLDSYDASVSLDGRYVAYKGFLKGGLRIRDLSTGEDRELGLVGSQPSQPRISPDDRLVACSSGSEVRVLGVDGTGLRTIWQKQGILVDVNAWAPDGSQVLVTFGYGLQSPELALVSLADGSERILTSSPRLGATANAFSPDGQHIVYQKRDGNANGVWIMNLGGIGEEPLVVDTAGKWNAGEPMWTSDGRRILFRSNRSGAPALYSLLITDGKAQGSPELLQQSIQGMTFLGLTRDGSLFTTTRTMLSDAFVADIDPTTRKVASTPQRVNQEYIGAIGTSIGWSPDGHNIVFGRTASGTSGTPADGASSLIEHSMDTGKELEIKPDGCTPRWFSYLPDGRSLLELDYGGKLDANQFFRRVDLLTGSASAVFQQGMKSFIFSQPGLSPDGNTLFYSSQTNYGEGLPLLTMQLVRRNLATGESKVLFETKTGGIGLFSISVSPNGKQVAFMFSPPPPDRPQLSLATISSDGGPIRVLQQGGITNSGTAWTKDGRNVLFVHNEKGTMQLYSVPAEGGVAQPVGIDMLMYSFALHPGGNRIAFIGGQFRVELWALKNLLSTLKPRR